MAKKNKMIPFEWLPASWGLSGQPLAEAKANYDLDGVDLRRRLIDIRHPASSMENAHEHLKIDRELGLVSDYEYDIKEAALLGGLDEPDPKTKLGIDKTHGKISAYDHDLKIAEIAYPEIDSLDRQLAMLNVDYDHGKIEKLEYEKTRATALNEPWVGIVGDGYNAEEGVNGLHMELDWNQQWVEFLRKNGYQGHNDDQIVEQWFADVCRSTAEETTVEDDQPVPFNSSRVHNRVRQDDGTEYRS